VILAAGPSSRFGKGPPKQLAVFEGETLLARTARRALASSLAEVVVVLGFEAEAIAPALAGLEARTVRNPEWAEGQSTSVRAGLSALDTVAAAVLFLTCDQPFLDTAVIDRIVATWRETDAAIVVPTWRGRHGSPVLFDRSLFGELRGISGDAGGRQLFARHESEIAAVELDDEGPLLDVDTLDDLDRLRR